ncbi:expressed conserved protein [Echinococcus multilocularis]|uniref:Expressed conserved protein n=1 Tax=Echinococcus multilocularis TaxID=6211 RepID=A0A087W1I8_ECHMU|nr:expressed conserved protein [Echinococcus multilocularis]
MRLLSSLVCLPLLLLSAFASYRVSAVVVSDGEAARKFGDGLFEASNNMEVEEVIEAMDDVKEEEELIRESGGGGMQMDVLVPTAWRQSSLRRPRKVPIPTCPNGGRGPGPMTP